MGFLENFFVVFAVLATFATSKTQQDHPVFYHHISSGHCIYLIFYVDYIIITGSDRDVMQKLKQHLFSYFQTKDFRKL